MMSKHALALIAALLLAAPVLAADAPPSDEELRQAVLNGKVLPEAWDVTAHLNGKEALISTWRPPDAGLVDCKIDAAMIAKTLMSDNHFGITRVKVDFHEKAGTSNVFQEVVVTAAEVAGFATGAVSKELFLDSLDVQKLPEKALIEKSEEKVAEITPIAATSPTTSAAVAKPTPQPLLTRMALKRSGISFNVPAGWKLTQPPGGETVFQMESPVTKEDNIELTYSVRGTPDSRLARMREEFSYDGVAFERVLPRTNFGTGPYPGAMIVVRYPNYNDNAAPWYEMHLYFGAYDLRAWCKGTNAKHIKPVFEEIVRSITFPTAAKKK